MCFPLPVPAEAPEDQMDALLVPNPLSETLGATQLVPSFPNPNGSSSPRDDPPPPAAPPLDAEIYSGILDKDAQLEDPDPVPRFRLLDDEDLSTPWSSSKDSRSWHSSASRVSAEEQEVWDSERAPDGNWLLSGDDCGEPSRNEISASAVVPSRVGAGLANLGNTCFLNAILQCFTHTVPLVQGLLSCSHLAPCDGDCGIDGFCVICALREQIECSLAASGRILSPLKLVDNLNNFSSFFRRYQQEDAHEFMQCTLDKLERCFLDLKKNKSFEDDNLVEKVFGGRLVSKLRCCNCGHSSDTYEPLIDLSLEIENVDTLPSALESFTMVENIDAKFRCDSCEEEVSMEKQLMLDQTPSVAAFHLKRFKTDGSYVEKIDKHVNFPLELDLQPYTISNQNNNVPLKYDLYAVVVHIGFSSTSGHYFCFVRSSPDTWHKLDDAKVTMVSGEYVLSQEAYILFYAQQGLPWFSSIMESPTPCLDPSILSTSPKSVLDIHDSMYKSNSITPANVVGGEVSESKEFSEQQFDYSCQERLEMHEVNDASDASNGCKQFPSVLNQENVGLNASKDTTNPQTALGSNAILNGSAMFDGNSFSDRDGREKNNCSEVVNFAEIDGFHPLTPPSSPSPDAPDRSFHIPRGHLKKENRGSCKRPLSKNMGDSEREAALRYVSKMGGSRRDAFMGLFSCNSETSLNKKRKKMDSSVCKKSRPDSVPQKSNHSSVMRPVAAGSSR